MTRIGSLCSGYGGLEMGVSTVVGGTVAWHAEVDPAASKVLAHNAPGVPNLGDITNVDWAAIEPVDVLATGFPCQDLSLAGRGDGMRRGNRSGLWFHIVNAIGALRPPLVVLENVRGLLSAGADSDVEPCPWCLGDAGDQHALRALGAVLGDLANLGYVGRWKGLRAADVGAPHGRFRVFVAATDASTSGRRGKGRADSECGHSAAPNGGRGTPEPRRRGSAPSDAPGATRRGPQLNNLGTPDRSTAELGERARPVADADLPGHQGSEPAPGRDVLARGVATNAPCKRRDERRSGAEGVVGGSDAALRSPINWGTYGPAIHRWETVLGRSAPAPTIRGTRGQPKLNPAFVEWLMGLSSGHVTAVPGISTNDMLRILGNGVVPQQAAAALRWLRAGQAVNAA